MATTTRRRTATAKPAQQQRAKRWTDIDGEMSVFGKVFNEGKGDEYVSYSASIGKKIEGSKDYENMYFKVRFPKQDPDIEGRFVIKAKSAFLSFDTAKKTGVQYPSVVVMDYEMIEPAEGFEPDDDDLPL